VNKGFQRVGGPSEDAGVALDVCSVSERRAEGDRRRNPLGWLEIRARRDGVAVDRRRPAEPGAGWIRRLGALRR
jgi:hypothetical protein